MIFHTILLVAITVSGALAFAAGESKRQYDSTALQVGMQHKSDLLQAHYAAIAAWQSYKADPQFTPAKAVVGVVGLDIASVSQSAPEACMIHDRAAACFMWGEGDSLILIAEAQVEGGIARVVKTLDL